MKTNLVKSALLAIALSFAFTACQNDPVINEVENRLEKKKIELDQIRPIENQNDRDLRLDELKKLPIRDENKLTPATPTYKNENKAPEVPIQKKIKIVE